MISALQIRAARKLLGWTQRDLADKAETTPGVVGRNERDETQSHRKAIEEALTAAGMKFVPGEGVRMARP